MEEEIRKQYEIETGKKWFTVPFTHGEQAFASWGYQLWLEKKISQVEPEVKVNFAELESIQYLNKMRELINLGDGININARLLILRRKIIDDVESLSKSKISA